MKFSIANYGAIPDGKTLNTEAIQRAINSAFLFGGGEVVIPPGTYVTGGLRLRSGVTLHLLCGAVLMGSTDPEDYTGYINDTVEPIPTDGIDAAVDTIVPGTNASASVCPYSRWNNAIIRAIHAKDIAIIGDFGSEINGQNCFDPVGEDGYRGPHAINMWFCENVILEGYTVRDSANWAHAIQNSKNIIARSITVLAGHDGFDVRTCDNVLVEDCSFLTGDDCIAGFDNIGVTVRNCYFESACTIFRFGSTNMLAENCTGIAPATYGFRGHLSNEEKLCRAATTEKCRHDSHGVFLYYCDNRANVRKTPGSILIRNSSFRNPDSIMRLPFGHKWCCNRSLADITFENCKFHGICEPIQLTCPADEPLSLVIKDCNVTARDGFEMIPLLTGENVKSVTLDGVTLENFENPEILCDHNTTVTVK